MRIICAKDYKEMSEMAADIIGAQVLLKPDAVLGLATGSTPIG
ncbi:MAG: glucosamine-6-phosphate deaminase, partial [Lachnoanaerobaculum gingivalis]